VNDGNQINFIEGVLIYKDPELVGAYEFLFYGDELIYSKVRTNEAFILDSHTGRKLSHVFGELLGAWDKVGKYLIMKDEGRIKIYEGKTGICVATLPAPKNITSVEMGADDKYVTIRGYNDDKKDERYRVFYVNPDDVLHAAKEKLRELEGER
jgi:hypothetical protein